MTVSKSENAQFTNSMAFGHQIKNSGGSSECSNTNHCVDESVADSYENGQVMENNGQTASGSSTRYSSSKSRSGGGGGGVSFLGKIFGISGSAKFNYGNTKSKETENTHSSAKGII